VKSYFKAGYFPDFYIIKKNGFLHFNKCSRKEGSMLFWGSLISCGIAVVIGVYGFLNAVKYEKNELEKF
jgi:hypothetical protein